MSSVQQSTAVTPLLPAPPPPQRYLNRAEAANYLGIGYSTLAIMAGRGEGPVLIKAGFLKGRVLYDIQDLDKWAHSHRTKPADFAKERQALARQGKNAGRGRPRGSKFWRNAPENDPRQRPGNRFGQALGMRGMRRKPIETAAAPVKTGRKAGTGPVVTPCHVSIKSGDRSKQPRSPA